MRLRLPALIVPLAGSLAACDGVHDSDYQGEVIASLQGTITAPAESQVPDLPENIGVAVVWEVKEWIVGARFMNFTEVTGEFPSRFRLDLRQPPDDRLPVEMPDGNAFMLGRLYLSALDGFDQTIGELGHSWGYWACSPETVIAYIRDDVAPGSATAAYLGCGSGTPDSPPCSGLTAGYHVMELVRADDDPSCYMAPPYYCPDDVRLADQDLETDIEMTWYTGDCLDYAFRDPWAGG